MLRLKMKTLKYIFVFGVFFLSTSLIKKESNYLIEKWELKQFIMHEKIKYYKGCIDSTYNHFESNFFDNEIDQKKAVIDLYEFYSQLELEFRKNKARTIESDNKNLKWRNYQIVNDFVFFKQNKSKRGIQFKLNDLKTELTLIDQFIKTVWTKKEM